MGAGGDSELDSLFYGLARTGLILRFGLPFNVFCVLICDLFYFSWHSCCREGKSLLSGLVTGACELNGPQNRSVGGKVYVVCTGAHRKQVKTQGGHYA